MTPVAVEVRFDELREVASSCTIPAMTSGSPARRATSTARWVPLSGWMRPRNSRYSPGPVVEGEGGEVDAVVDRRVVGQVRVAVRIADRDVVPDVVVGAVDRHDPLRREAVDGRHDRRRHQPAVGQREEVELLLSTSNSSARSNAAAMCRHSYTLTSIRRVLRPTRRGPAT